MLQNLARRGEIDPHHGANVRYTNPLTGDWAIPTIAASMRLIPSGFTTEYFRSIDGAIAVGMEGEPSIEIDGCGRFTLNPNDVFAVPGWSRWRMSSGSHGDGVLFTYSDRPVYGKLGLYREQRG